MAASEIPPSDVSVHAMSKWRMVAWFWAAQSVLVVAVLFVWVIQVDTAGPGHPFGDLDWNECARVLKAPEFWGWVAVFVFGLAALQALIVWPVRRPRPRTRGGWPVWLSLAASSLVGVGLTVAVVCGLSTIGQVESRYRIEISERTGYVLIIGWCFVFWVAGWILMHGFCSRTLRRGGRYEQALARISAVLFTGTIVEAAAVMPLDVLYRKRETCYCAAGTLWAYTILIPAGLITLGPAIFLPILMRRRKRWYASRCACCGYDMTGLLESEREFDRCPECGAGWRR